MQPSLKAGKGCATSLPVSEAHTCVFRFHVCAHVDHCARHLCVHSRFVILNLEPLSADQSKQAVQGLLKDFKQGREFSDHLLSVLDIRCVHSFNP